MSDGLRDGMQIIVLCAQLPLYKCTAIELALWRWYLLIFVFQEFSAFFRQRAKINEILLYIYTQDVRQ